jgi:proteasome lid subunit RPN8/RPN11
VERRVAGCWHTHPVSPEPSEADRDSWRSRLELGGWRAWVSVIVHRGRALAWLTAPDERGWITTQRLPLKIEPVAAHTLVPSIGDRGLKRWQL